jgi:glycerol-3-phosphate O-acyltransferase
LMLDRGFPIEYFIEGSRSRSGRMLSPKAGILAMTVQSFVSQHSRPLLFVPVYVGYEKLMEGGVYLEELEGKPKKAESLLGLLGAVRVLKQYFGKVHVNFGPPLALEEFLDRQHANWRTSPLTARPRGCTTWSRPLPRNLRATSILRQWSMQSTWWR